MSDINNTNDINEESVKVLTPFQKKVKFIWDYYKLHILLSIIGVLVIIYVVTSILGQKPYGFYAIMLNTFGADYDLAEKFADYSGINTEEYDVVVNTNTTMGAVLETTNDLATSQMIDAMTENQYLDVMVTDPQVFYIHALKSYFVDLTTVLSPEELELWKDNLYYVDMAEYRWAYENADEFGPNFSWITDELVDDDIINGELDNHRSPDGMEEPVLVGIILNDSGFMEHNNCFKGRIPVVGIIANSTKLDESVKFFHFLWEYE